MTRPLWRAGGIAAALVAVLGACAPAWNWRELPLANGVARVNLACKPTAQTRDVTLSGRAGPLAMTLWTCEHAGVTQAVALADVGDPAQVPSTLRLWREATLHNLGAQAPPQRLDWAVHLATPQPEAGRWLFDGQRSDGTALHVQTALASRGTWVLQTTLISPEPLPPAVLQGFFEGVAFGP